MDKKEENKNKANKANSTTYIMIAIIIVLVFVIGSLLLIKGCSKDNDNKAPENNEIEQKGAKEEDLIKAYGMSKEDAINIVKDFYNSDNYEFACEINKESKYIVIVTNTITEEDTKYLVDPTIPDKSFSMITE